MRSRAMITCDPSDQTDRKRDDRIVGRSGWQRTDDIFSHFFRLEGLVSRFNALARGFFGSRVRLKPRPLCSAATAASLQRTSPIKPVYFFIIYWLAL